ncbi:OmpA family protein [Marinobacter sp. ANT_B65]|uniref:OmpA family protein n=1 Tax=Marinobacter sp. ANT_B65 TaxID=2039467 RepID=UPI000BBE9C9A|nr:DUF4157 domain-containing protein [Marinobacter sp. ANT_B65]PCM46121.1 hypothetical protein CPA50_09305 [Marinobacter sp. ANT_B65]
MMQPTVPDTGRHDPIQRPPQSAAELQRLENDADRFSDAALAGRRTPLSGPSLPRGPGTGFSGLGSGKPIPPHLQGRLSRNLGLDLKDIRLHDDARARATTGQLHANAAVSGNQIALGRDSESQGADELIAHEVAHLTQGARADALPGVLCNEGGDSRGIGTSPPEATYTLGSGAGPEDAHVVFDFDSAELTPGARASLRQLAQNQTTAVNLDLYGYASAEGANDYNVNLSAHRAVAVQRFLQPLLPENSLVTVHAHGEISRFEEPSDNRRVGIDVQQQTGTSGNGQLPGLPLPATPPPRLPERFRLRLASPLTLQPPLAQGIFQIPPMAAANQQLDFLPMARAASARGLHLPDLVDQGELESAYALHRRLYPWIPEDPASVRNWLASKIVGAIGAQAFTERTFEAQLSQEHPGLLEDMERREQIDRMMRGEEEPFVIPPITIFELQFDITSRGLVFE